MVEMRKAAVLSLRNWKYRNDKKQNCRLLHYYFILFSPSFSFSKEWGSRGQKGSASPLHCSWSLHSSLGWELSEVSVWVPGPPPPCQQSFTLWLIWSYSGSPYKKWVRDVCDWETNVFLEILTFHPVLIWSFGLWRSWWATFFESPDNP